MGHIKNPKHLKNRAITEEKMHVTKNKKQINQITSLNHYKDERKNKIWSIVDMWFALVIFHIEQYFELVKEF